MKNDLLLLFGLIILGMGGGALLTNLHYRSAIARIVREELEAELQRSGSSNTTQLLETPVEQTKRPAFSKIMLRTPE